jgi:hypothetical protein
MSLSISGFAERLSVEYRDAEVRRERAISGYSGGVIARKTVRRRETENEMTKDTILVLGGTGKTGRRAPRALRRRP